MTSYEIARLVERMVDVLELTGENVFRVRAYRRAAQNLETLSEDVETLAREHRLEDSRASTPISPARSIEALVDAAAAHGRVDRLDRR